MKIGQSAVVTSDAFSGKTVTGKITSVSAEASGERYDGRVPSFELPASFSVDDEALLRSIRIGMSA